MTWLFSITLVGLLGVVFSGLSQHYKWPWWLGLLLAVGTWLLIEGVVALVRRIGRSK